MYESNILILRKFPVFSLSDVSQIVSGKEYAKKLLRKLVLSGNIKKIRRDAYTFYDDPLLVSTFLVKPSYISSVSALSYNKLISQIPKDIFCFTTKQNKEIQFISKIKFVHTNYFFGFENIDYMGFKVLMATPEKAIIDSIGLIPFSILEEAFEKIDVQKMLNLLKKIKKSSILKRIGYILEKQGFDIFNKIKNNLNNRYIYLDPLSKKQGIKNKKWKLIINIK